MAALLAELFQTMRIRVSVVDDIPKDSNAVIYLPGINRIRSIYQAIELNKKAFTIGRSLAKNISSSGLIVTVQDTGGCFGINKNCHSRAWLGGIAGLAKTADKEWSGSQAKAIDICCNKVNAETIAQRIFSEIVAGSSELEVAIDQHGKRWAPEMKQISYSSESFAKDHAPLQQDDVVVISGGAKGVTAYCLQYLATKGSLKVAILGRSQLKEESAEIKDLLDKKALLGKLFTDYQACGKKVSPIELNKEVNSILASREVTHNIEELQKLNCEVRYYSVDVQDKSFVAECINKIREELGPIKCLVHAAGVLSDKLLHDKTDEQFNRVFDTKVLGFLNLLEATKEDMLSHICCFSSIAARTGNAGQVDYVMGNEVLNKVCQSEAIKRGDHCVVKAINWGPWEGGMVDEALRKHFIKNGIGLLSLDAGADYFVETLTSRHSQPVETVVGSNITAWEIFQLQNKAQERVIWVHKSKHPYLVSHQVNNVPILPMVIFHEWCLRLVYSLFSQNIVVTCHNIKVTKAIKLSAYEGAGNWVKIRYQLQEQNADCCVLMFSVSDALTGQESFSMSAEVRLDSQPNVEIHAPLSYTGSSSITKKNIYGDILFHGNHFHVIQKINSLNDAHIIGSLRTEYLLSADEKQWCTDPLIIDGGLQLASVWINHKYQASALPAQIDSITVYKPGLFSENINCEITLVSQNQLYAKGNIVYFTDDGVVVAKALGVNSIVLNKSYDEVEL